MNPNFLPTKKDENEKMQEKQVRNIHLVHEMNMNTFGVHCKDCVSAGQKAKDKEVNLCYSGNCEGKPAYCLFHFKKEGFDREEHARADERKKTLDEVEKALYYDLKCRNCYNNLKRISALRPKGDVQK